jgi:hypothetical protein
MGAQTHSAADGDAAGDNDGKDVGEKASVGDDDETSAAAAIEVAGCAC